MRLLEKLNKPQAFFVVLAIVLVTDGLLLYHYRLAGGDAAPSSSPPPAASAQPLAVEGGKGGGQEAEVSRAEEAAEEADPPGGEKEGTLGATRVSAEPASAGSAAYLAPEAADPATLPTAMPAPAYSNSGYERQYGTQPGTQYEWWWVTY